MIDPNVLTNTDFGEDFYREHVEAGIDYLAFGEWHKSYARMLTSATLQETYLLPFFVDIGCACGALVEGFRCTGLYSRVCGIDVSTAMVEKGRKKFCFNEDELIIGSATEIPIADGQVTLLNSGQVLEHIPDSQVPAIIAECYRVLRPGGRMFHNLAALKYGDAPDIHDYDPTHVNVKPTLYWAKHFARTGFIADFESYDRFVRSNEVPGDGYPNFFASYTSWTSFMMIKPHSAPKSKLLQK